MGIAHHLDFIVPSNSTSSSWGRNRLVLNTSLSMRALALLVKRSFEDGRFADDSLKGRQTFGAAQPPTHKNVRGTSKNK